MGEAEGRLVLETHLKQQASAHQDPYIHITLSEAAWLLDHVGLAAGPLSPFKKAQGTRGGESERVSLAAKGLIDPAGRLTAPMSACIRTLADPGCEMVMDIGNATLLNFMRIYFGADGPPAGCTPVGQSTFRLAFGLKLEDLLVTVLEGLNLDSTIRENPVSLDVSPKGLLALAALIDAIRQNQLRSLLNRNDNEGIDVDFIDIWASLQHGILEDDFRWLTAVIRSRLPDDLTIDQSALSEGLAQIAAAGMAVRKEDESWTLSDRHIAALTELMTPLNFGSIFARAASGGTAVRLFLIKCPASLWAVNFGAQDKKASVFTLSVDRLGSMMAEIVARLVVTGAKISRTQSRQQPVTDSAGKNDSVQAADAARAKRFCSQCGQPLKPEHKFCKACGKPVS